MSVRCVKAAAVAAFAATALIGEASAQGAQTAKLLVADRCPSDVQDDPDREVGFLAALLPAIAPKLINFGSNVLRGAMQSAAIRAENNRTALMEASSSYNFYVYERAEPKALYLNPEAGCLIFVAGQFGGRDRLSESALKPLSALIHASEIAAKPHYSKKSGSSYLAYFRSLGLKEAPNLYAEFKIEQAFADIVENPKDASMDAFQARPILLWYRASIGSKSPDRDPDIGLSFEFQSVARNGDNPLWSAADPTGGAPSRPTDINSAVGNSAIQFKDLPFGTLLGPKELLGLRTRPMLNYPDPSVTDASSVTASETEYRRLVSKEASCSGADCYTVNLGDDLQTMLGNRVFFYIRPLDYQRDPLLYIGQYLPAEQQDICRNAAVIEHDACRYKTNAQLQALALDLLMKSRATLATCLEEAGDREFEKVKCRSADEQEKHRWEVKRREAMEVLNRYEGRFMDKLQAAARVMTSSSPMTRSARAAASGFLLDNSAKIDGLADDQAGSADLKRALKLATELGRDGGGASDNAAALDPGSTTPVSTVVSGRRSISPITVAVTLLESRDLGVFYQAFLAELKANAQNKSPLLSETQLDAVGKALFPNLTGKTEADADARYDAQMKYRTALLAAEQVAEFLEFARANYEYHKKKLEEARAGGKEDEIRSAESEMNEKLESLRTKELDLLTKQGVANVKARAANVDPLPYPDAGAPASD